MKNEKQKLFAIHYIKELTLWEKLLLKFSPVHIGIDPSDGKDDYTAKVYMKEIFGVYYIMKVEVMK